MEKICINCAARTHTSTDKWTCSNCSQKNSDEINHALDQARTQLESIHELTSKLTGNPQDDEISALEVIRDDALEVSIRSNWASSKEEWEANDFLILLCTGGPAVRIRGQLDEYNQPRTAQLEYQDWGTPWTRLPLTDEDIDALLTYAGCFYFGE